MLSTWPENEQRLTEFGVAVKRNEETKAYRETVLSCDKVCLADRQIEHRESKRRRKPNLKASWWGKRSTRQARVFSTRNASPLALLNTSRLVEWFRDTRRAWSASVGAGQRRGTWCSRRERKGRSLDAEERRKMQNLTVQATGASGDGFQEFVLDPPSRNFFYLCPVHESFSWLTNTAARPSIEDNVLDW